MIKNSNFFNQDFKSNLFYRMLISHRDSISFFYIIFPLIFLLACFHSPSKLIKNDRQIFISTIYIM